MYRKLFLGMVYMILVSLLAGQNLLAQDESLSRQDWNRIMREYGFRPIKNIPTEVNPVLVTNEDEVRNLVQMIQGQAQAHEIIPEAAPLSEIPSDVMATGTYFQVREIKVCSAPVGLGAFNGYADVTIGIWNGVYRAYLSINGKWWSPSGITTGLSISNVYQNYYLATSPPSSLLWMLNNFTVNYYIISPWGDITVYSQPSYANCSIPA